MAILHSVAPSWKAPEAAAEVVLTTYKNGTVRKHH